MHDKELVIVTLRDFPSIRETFITNIRKNNVVPSLDDLIGKLTHEESRMASRDRMQKNVEGEPITFITHNKKKKEK